MKKYFLMLILASGSVHAESFYYNSSVSIKGTLVSETASSDITYDEKEHTYPAVKLSKPIDVLCELNDLECQPEIGIDFLQLVLKPNQIKQFKVMNHHHVIINGELFHADNGNHYTSVLIDVKSIK
jgi:hypothetical protein